MIYTITLNNALDKIMTLTKPLGKRVANKVEHIKYDVGGKSTHVSIVLSALNIKNIALGFIGGPNGDKIDYLLKQRNVDTDFIRQPMSDTRLSTIILDNESGSYMITEKGFVVSDESYNKLISYLEDKLQENDFVVMSGGVPPEFTKDMYSNLLRIIKSKTKYLFIDTSGDNLKESLKYKPYFIKPNQYEFSELVNRELNSLNDYIDEIKKLNNYGIENVVVTLGKDGSLVLFDNNIYKITPPKVKEVNDTGCGDVFVGGFVSQKYLNKSTLEAIIFATAISTSKSTKNDSSSFDLEETMNFIKEVKIDKLT